MRAVTPKGTKLMMLRITAAAVVAMLALSSAAKAEDARVAYGDLDLSTAAGSAQLDQRIETAADSLCQMRPSPAQLNASADCRTNVRSEVMRQLPRAQAQAAQSQASRTQLAAL
jgi:UrcA family protein